MAGKTIGQLKKDRRKKETKQAAFLEAFSDYASVSRAAKKAKVPRSNVYLWLNDDPDFKAKYEAACTVALAALEDEATRRAHEGTLEPVYQGGKKVGTIRKYSDTLLIFLLKGLAPEKYRERQLLEHVGKGGKDLYAGLSDEELDRRIAEREKKLKGGNANKS